MYLYIKQKLFSFGDKYDVFDANDQVVLDVMSEVFTFGAKIHVCDHCGQELYYIQQNFTLFLKQYEIYRGEVLCATIQQELSFLKPRLTILSDYGEFEITGDFFNLDYEIRNNQCFMGSVHKKWLSWGDAYELFIPDGSDYAFFATLVIAIDNCIHNDKK